MILFTAMDLQGGQCVRLVQGRFEDSTVYGDDPVAMAKKWESEGAEWLHIVDLDGAKAGGPRQWDIAIEVARAVDIPVQLGGGPRTLEQIQGALDGGIARIILGSIAVRQPDLAKAAFERFGERVVLGLDAKEGRVAVQGWLEVADAGLYDLAQAMESAGARRIIYTDISRDGMLTGVNLEATQKLAETVSIPVIASGGVSSLNDLRTLKALPGRGVEGVIIGKALYSGAFTLREALEAVSGAP